MYFTTETKETWHPVRIQSMANTELQHPEREIELETAENVRDLGGYTTRNGDKTRWRVFVRSGDMDGLSPSDQQTFVAYGINTVIDLRMQKEIDASPNPFSNSAAVDFKIHDFWGTRFDDYRSTNKQASPPQKLADLYCLGLEQSGFVMAEIMSTFAADERSGFAFHCRSGKDRTGLVAALLLSIAEVPRDTICADYALTADYLKQTAINPIEANKPGAWQRGCAAETMALTLSFLDQRFDGALNYLRAQGVSDDDLDTIRAKFVTDAAEHR
jgi:protein-tyrosine phosphatase